MGKEKHKIGAMGVYTEASLPRGGLTVQHSSVSDPWVYVRNKK